MAGGKQSPRQKMINLMYLVFIAMLALNMSKEVLSAFGSINEKFDRSNTTFEAKNELALADLSKKANENEEFKAAAATAKSAKDLGDAYFAYLAAEKDALLAEVEDPKDYESMDKSNFIDERYYAGGKISPKGQEFLNQMTTYREGMLELAGDNEALSSQINADFSTADIVDSEGVEKDYISYNYVGFPSVSSLTKLSQLQNDIKVVENELLTKLLSGNLKELASLDNYETVMTTSKGAYYTGSKFDGVLSLGRVDESTKPSRVELKLDGRAIPEDKISYDGGKLVLGVNTGGVGTHEITGSLFYPQDGKEIEVAVTQAFTTINKPNSATIAADKMNVVYRGVANPMTISFAGVSDNAVTASGTGLSKRSGSSYIMKPGKGREVTINVNAKLPDGGGTVSDKAVFRIKDIPRPVGALGGDDSGSLKKPRGTIEKAPIGAVLPDFDFNLNLKVNSFKFRAGEAATVSVRGDRLNAQAKSALKRAKRGSTVQIFDIKASIKGNSGYRLKTVSPILIELAN
ncbi:gliding motility protein GldM [Dokdonia sp. Hel_I_53]|uniref:type IX secretion system motor protein PorM/GldM n=1 Tax=Dokdonia sp. Hel_I_53 TaxID=1566287 RepID=UPI0011991DA1|nr:gliding motility protein GldM [Dokdonia sp. Hel_I_53]TVZ52144.1 protein involved in gliding motility GldM [Dokdonia sp. Hel_I_53]